jgi:hypothetical protein
MLFVLPFVIVTSAIVSRCWCFDFDAVISDLLDVTIFSFVNQRA